MFKFLSVSLLLILTVKSVYSVPVLLDEQIHLYNGYSVKTDGSSQWGLHILDFLDLIHIEDIFGVVIKYVHDPEVLNLITFIQSSEFKELVWEFESIAEFKEALVYLASKGYDVEYLIQLINSALNLPPFEIETMKTRTGEGISGLIQDLVHALPLKEMKQLFESKLENDAEVAAIFETINSEEFIEILKRMSKNPKFIDMTKVFKDLGFDVKLICSLAEEIFGDYYQGIFCE